MKLKVAPKCRNCNLSGGLKMKKKHFFSVVNRSVDYRTQKRGIYLKPRFVELNCAGMSWKHLLTKEREFLLEWEVKKKKYSGSKKLPNLGYCFWNFHPLVWQVWILLSFPLMTRIIYFTGFQGNRFITNLWLFEILLCLAQYWCDLLGKPKFSNGCAMTYAAY